MFSTLRRILRSGFVNFWRNGFVTLASILVMTVTLFVMGSLIFVDAMLDASLAQIEEKVDVNVYFTLDTTDEEAIAIQEDLLEMPEVEEVEYISREQALEEFERRHVEDALITTALEELEENPLGAYLNVRAEDTTDYEEIASYLESEQSGAANNIDNVNYFQNREAIDRLTDIVDSIDTLSLAILIFFVIISVLIIFNTIRLGIYTAREEIAVMKLVGASNTYIRGPFVIEGVMYGIVSSLLALVFFYPLTLWLGPSTETFFGEGSNVFDYYVNNFAELFIILVLMGAILGAFSSFLAVKKYLQI